jgi:hypothetical protein
MRHIVALCALALVGCGDDFTPPTDLAVVPLDLSPAGARDLADLTPLPPWLCPYTPDAWTPPTTPVDAGVFCAGTPIDGTCVQAFFAKIAACFQPAGCCTLGPNIHEKVDWASGAHYYWYATEDQLWYSQGGAACGGQSSPSFGVSGQWTGPDGSALTVTPAISRYSFGPFDATCPDGTHVSFNTSDCAELVALISPSVQGCVTH